MLYLSWILGLALAQTPGTPVEIAYVTRDLKLLRWPDADVVGAEVKASAKVDVMARLDGKVRVRSGTDFGWVPADALSDAPPAGDE